MKPIYDYKCLECGKLMTDDQFVDAMSSDEGCPKCGSMDIDVHIDREGE